MREPPATQTASAPYGVLLAAGVDRFGAPAWPHRGGIGRWSARRRRNELRHDRGGLRGPAAQKRSPGRRLMHGIEVVLPVGVLVVALDLLLGLRVFA